jgi:hypothetical protein
MILYSRALEKHHRRREFVFFRLVVWETRENRVAQSDVDIKRHKKQFYLVVRQLETFKSRYIAVIGSTWNSKTSCTGWVRSAYIQLVCM